MPGPFALTLHFFFLSFFLSARPHDCPLGKQDCGVLGKHLCHLVPLISLYTVLDGESVCVLKKVFFDAVISISCAKHLDDPRVH